MKSKMWMLATVLTLAVAASGATNDLTGLLQKGMFEEEANRNLDAAIANYQTLANAFDKDRELAASAIFRLGECYRKLGRTNDAVIQYERIVHEFGDQQTLVTLSKQNLGGLGASASSAKNAEPDTLQQLQSLLVKAQNQTIEKKSTLQLLKAMDRQALRKALPTVVPDARLSALMSELDVAEQALLSTAGQYGREHPNYLNAKTGVDDLNRKVDDRIDGIMLGLQVQLDASTANMDSLKKEIATAHGGNGGTTATGSQDSAVTDEEEKEIRNIQAMIQNSPDLINAPSGDPPLTPLGRASSLGQLRVAKFLIDAKADVNQTTDGLTPLQYAAANGQRAMVELLLANRAEVEAKSSSGQTALQLAAQHGFVSVAETLLAAKADINTPDDLGNTALTFAVQNGHRPLAALLLAHGANPNVVTAKGPRNLGDIEDLLGTPLHFAVIRKDEPMTALLLSNHADVTIRSPRGYNKTPLDIAAENGSVEIARRLLDAGASPNPVGGSPGELTPLFRAVSGKQLEIVKLLVSKGANPNATARYGDTGNQTPLMVAVFGTDKEIASVLLENKADPNLRNDRGSTALWYSFQRQPPDFKMASLLIQHGADPNQVADQGITPLMQLSGVNGVPSEERLSVARDLISKGAKINAQDDHGNTALHFAVTHLRSDMVELLLANHADVNVQNRESKTPLDLAKSQYGQGVAPIQGGIITLANNQSGTLNIVDNTATVSNPETNIVSLLRQHGALDELPDFHGIRVTRQGMPGSAVFFEQQSNDWNHYTLLETILEVYSRDKIRIEGSLYATTTWFKFPDLTRIIVHRLDRKVFGKGKDITVNLLNSTNGVDCSRDIPLDFGDTVEIPVRDYSLGEPEVGLTESQKNTSENCLKLKVRLIVRGESQELTPYPLRAYLGATVNTGSARSFLLSSSDLTRVKVTRKDKATGGTQEFIVDTTKSRGYQDLRLRDGDVIEVPEKQ